MSSLVYCPACGLTRPADAYVPGNTLCRACRALDSPALVSVARATCVREHASAQLNFGARAAAVRAARLAAHAESGGKRCSACHARKPVTDYYRCASRSDGYQPACRACMLAQRALLSQPGGRAMWHTVRDALRAQHAGE